MEVFFKRTCSVVLLSRVNSASALMPDGSVKMTKSALAEEARMVTEETTIDNDDNLVIDGRMNALSSCILNACSRSGQKLAGTASLSL